ncbi:MAG TPA: hypothetical protein VJ890_13730 [Vineibacter sp.]|nr:hypothetical protein [Vineibacter sp.]
MIDDRWSLKWLIGESISEVEFLSESETWCILLSRGSTLNVPCLWRLRLEGKLVATSSDHLHSFGLKELFDAAKVLREYSMGVPISSVEVDKGSLDLRIAFGPRLMLEILLESAGYESWSACHSSGVVVIARGDGELISY